MKDTEPRVQRFFHGSYPERDMGRKPCCNAGLCVSLKINKTKMQITNMVLGLLFGLDVLAIIIGVPVGIIFYSQGKHATDPVKQVSDKKIAKRAIWWPISLAFIIILLYVIANVIGNLSKS